MEITPVILSGGKGTRLWPLSDRENPKPFLSIDGQKSLLALAIERALWIGAKKIILVTSDSLLEKTIKVLEGFSDVEFHIISEAKGRNTAMAFALAGEYARRHFGNSLMQFFPADHLIEGKENFLCSIQESLKLSKAGKFGSLGIVPSHPEVGYGYLCLGTKQTELTFLVKEFKEKPDLANAENYLKSGQYLWNSGIYFSSSNTLFDKFAQHEPSINSSAAKALLEVKQKNPNIFIASTDLNAMAETKNISIDYALSEKVSDFVVIKTDAYWKDLGSWQSWKEGMEKIGITEGDKILSKGSKNAFVKSSNNKPIAILGLPNIYVIETEAGLLISSEDGLKDVASAYDLFES